MRASLFIFFTIALVSSQKSKDNDEGRPYEFGFTIDGQQHRHEKKDSNGIIQGEFGFITADGVYHVTVYATDENGNFKILSMKNIRVSAPLDGSPALGPISPEASKYLGNQNPPSSTQPPQFQKIQQQPIAQVPKTVTPFQGFTTQPTIRPACAGCGYVTTAKSTPGQAFGNQNGIFRPQQVSSQSQSFSGESLDLVRPPDAEVISQGIRESNGIQSYPNQPTGTPPATYNLKSQIQGPLSSVQPHVGFQGQQPNSQYQENTAGGPNRLPDLQNRFQNTGNGGLSFGQAPNSQTSNVAVPVSAQSPGRQGPYIGEGSPLAGTAGINPSLQSQDITQLPPIAVKDNVIHVGGKIPQDIPIQDKYPGMTDGLPDGIEEKDITNILYKFKYIVGFHGHWERGLKNGAKIGGYFVNGRDGISRVVNYIADENGYRPKFKFINLGLDSDETPKEGSEKKFGLKSFEFMWYPLG